MNGAEFNSYLEQIIAADKSFNRQNHYHGFKTVCRIIIRLLKHIQRLDARIDKLEEIERGGNYGR